jgi:hypothetical protein
VRFAKRTGAARQSQFGGLGWFFAKRTGLASKGEFAERTQFAQRGPSFLVALLLSRTMVLDGLFRSCNSAGFLESGDGI